MLDAVITFLAANPYNITANEIGVPTSTGTVGAGLVNITRILMSVIGMLAIIFIIISGIQMALSAGNPKRFEQARETLVYAVIGLAVAIAAYAVVSFVAGSVKR